MYITGLRKISTLQLNPGFESITYYNPSIKFFEEEENAQEYKEYLYSSVKMQEGYEPFTAESKVYSKGELNINELRIQDALLKLTDLEKQLLKLA